MTEGEEKTEEVQTGVRPLRGAGGQPEGWGSTEGRGWGGEEGGREVAVVAMEMTRNVSLPLAILMG